VTVKEKGSAQTNMAQLVSEMASHDGMSLGHELSTRGQAFLVLLDWPHEEGNIAEAKNNLSALIDGLKGGGSRVLIVDRGRPVARLEPATGYFEGGQDGRLERLLREGLVRPRWRGRLAPCSAASRRTPMPAHRLSTSSSRSARRGGDILGRFGDRAAAGCRTHDTAHASACRAGFRQAGVVRVGSRIRLGDDACSRGLIAPHGPRSGSRSSKRRARRITAASLRPRARPTSSSRHSRPLVSLPPFVRSNSR
jgi:antitoxin (DNA-binding transcriptional repressor) of toxin-antitoxin stability system